MRRHVVPMIMCIMMHVEVLGTMSKLRPLFFDLSYCEAFVDCRPLLMIILKVSAETLSTALRARADFETKLLRQLHEEAMDLAHCGVEVSVPVLDDFAHYLPKMLLCVLLLGVELSTSVRELGDAGAELRKIGVEAGVFRDSLHSVCQVESLY